MDLNPRIKDQTICKVVNSITMSKEIVIEIDGMQLDAMKVFGATLASGECAFLKTYKGSGKSLVLPLTKAERNYHKDEIDEVKNKSNNVDVKKIKTLRKEAINDDNVKRKIQVVLQTNTPIRDSEKIIKDVFSVVAVQRGSRFDKLKTELYIKADETIHRNYIKKCDDKDVCSFLINMINKIKSKQDHFHFFKAIQVYLKRLNGVHNKNTNDGAHFKKTFHPIYNAYVDRFEKKYINMWVSRNNLVGF
ncbi:MAG: hypothetical protein COA79_19580 [Planctomycetota bacterium]|nr:MAG: hypothetical protein COA79_19580 [Planctomycetota bacterium]